MNLDMFRMNVLNPPVLFFFLGVAAGFLRSGLEIPKAFSQFLSLYLLMAIGFKGGAALASSGLSAEAAAALSAAVALSVVIPLYVYFILRRKLDGADAAAIAASYGSVSLVTFIAATEFLRSLGLQYGGHMVAALALMESPAIIIGVWLARRGRPEEKGHTGDLIRESFLNGPVFLLLGSFVIGWVTGPAGTQAFYPFTDQLFKGMLAFFLLDLGMSTAARFGDLKKAGWSLVAAALLIPIVNAVLALAAARVIGLGAGDAFLLTVLCASASYIAVPAAMQLAVPRANPGLYTPLPLAVTFPFNVALGLPLYYSIIQMFWK